MPPEDKNRIEDLKQSLYSRTAPEIRSRRRLRYSTEQPDVPHAWEGQEEGGEGKGLAVPPDLGGRHKMSFIAKFFIGSAAFCIIALGIGAYIFFNGANFISGNNIAIQVSGPVSVPGGTPVTFAITVTNKNSVALKTADLTVHFPPGTTDPADTTQALDEHKEVLGDLPPGGSVTKSVQAVIFGEQNTQKPITATVTYGIAGSSSVFTKESSYDVVVNESPVSVSVSSLQEAISGQDFDLDVDVKSNASNTVKNVILQATYPFGYSFKSAAPAPVASNNGVWAIGDIPPGGERHIKIHGALTGEDTDIRAFRFILGARSASDPTAIGTSFVQAEQVVSIKKPFISLSVGVDNDYATTDHIGAYGHPMNVMVKWSNNLPETISNVVITAHLSGSAYQKTGITAWSGYYRSITDDVVWDQKTNPELASVASGADGTLSFTISTPQSQSGAPTVNPVIDIAVSAAGDRTSSSNVPLDTGSIARSIRLTGGASLSGRIVRSSGAIANSGPIPPIAEQKTTYTVDWTVDHSSNAMTGASVTATLPPYVTWTGQISPSTEDISYDKNSGVVTWNIGNLDAPAAGSASGARREAQFQISLLPSVSQIGQAPVLVNQSRLTATDAWTGDQVESVQGYLTTSFSTDPSFKRGDDIVANKR